MTHWRINGLQMFEKIWDLLCFQSCTHTETRIRPSPDVPLRLLLPLLPPNNGDGATDQTASEGETSGALSSRCHDNDSEASEAESYIARTIGSEAPGNSGYVSM
jgi:hypothetical protein